MTRRRHSQASKLGNSSQLLTFGVWTRAFQSNTWREAAFWLFPHSDQDWQSWKPSIGISCKHQHLSSQISNFTFTYICQYLISISEKENKHVWPPGKQNRDWTNKCLIFLINLYSFCTLQEISKLQKLYKIEEWTKFHHFVQSIQANSCQESLLEKNAISDGWSTIAAIRADWMGSYIIFVTNTMNGIWAEKSVIWITIHGRCWEIWNFAKC